MNIQTLSSQWSAYKLLDSGNRKKLEQFGSVKIIRSEPKAWWTPILPASEWKKAVAVHEEDSRDGFWKFFGKEPEQWQMNYEDKFSLYLRFMDKSKQIGVFPEQSPHWDFILNNPPPKKCDGKLLNLFGYTGAATLAAAAAGWNVTHVDASKPAVAWGRRNQELSKLQDAPIRWILEDAVKFCQREQRRGNKYDAILLDPPAFGRGPNGELWKVERDLVPLLKICRDLLSDNACLMILTIYTTDASSILCGNLLQETCAHLKGGKLEIGELAIAEQFAEKRLLPLSLWSRWSRF